MGYGLCHTRMRTSLRAADRPDETEQTFCQPIVTKLPIVTIPIVTILIRPTAWIASLARSVPLAVADRRPLTPTPTMARSVPRRYARPRGYKPEGLSYGTNRATPRWMNNIHCGYPQLDYARAHRPYTLAIGRSGSALADPPAESERG